MTDCQARPFADASVTNTPRLKPEEIAHLARQRVQPLVVRADQDRAGASDIDRILHDAKPNRYSGFRHP